MSYRQLRSKPSKDYKYGVSLDKPRKKPQHPPYRIPLHLPRNNGVTLTVKQSQELYSNKALHAQNMAALNPKGFRQPSNKAKKWYSTSLIQNYALKASGDTLKWEGSKRGNKRRERAAQLWAKANADPMQHMSNWEYNHRHTRR